MAQRENRETFLPYYSESSRGAGINERFSVKKFEDSGSRHHGLVVVGGEGRGLGHGHCAQDQGLRDSKKMRILPSQLIIHELGSKFSRGCIKPIFRIFKGVS